MLIKYWVFIIGGSIFSTTARREEQQRLRQALKVLAECEKQLRASSDRSTWLTAALLQFAPDRSYLPSSVDTSMAPSPIAFDTLEKVATGEPDTPRLPHPPPGDPRRAASSRKASQPNSSPNNNNKDKAHHKVPRVIHNTRTEKQKSQAPAGNSSSNTVEGRRTRGVPHVANQLQAKVHPSTTESPSNIIIDDDDDGSGLPRSRSLVLFDPARISGTRDFRVLSRRDLEDIWGKVLEGCRSNVLRQLLSSQGTLMALFVARGTCRSGFSAFSVISLVMKYQSILKPRWIHIPLLTSVRLVSPFFDTTW